MRRFASDWNPVSTDILIKGDTGASLTWRLKPCWSYTAALLLSYPDFTLSCYIFCHIRAYKEESVKPHMIITGSLCLVSTEGRMFQIKSLKGRDINNHISDRGCWYYWCILCFHFIRCFQNMTANITLSHTQDSFLKIPLHVEYSHISHFHIKAQIKMFLWH